MIPNPLRATALFVWARRTEGIKKLRTVQISICMALYALLYFCQEKVTLCLLCLQKSLIFNYII